MFCKITKLSDKESQILRTIDLLLNKYEKQKPARNSDDGYYEITTFIKELEEIKEIIIEVD